MKNWLNVDFTSPNPSKGGERTARKSPLSPSGGTGYAENVAINALSQLPLFWRGQVGGASVVLRHCGLDPQSVAYNAHRSRHCGLDPQSVAYNVSLQEIAGQARNDGRGICPNQDFNKIYKMNRINLGNLDNLVKIVVQNKSEDKNQITKSTNNQINKSK